MGLREKMPETASGIGPVNSFGSVAEYGLTAEQTPLETPSQFTGMIESDAPFKVHSTVSPLEIVTAGGEKEPSGFTFTMTVPADIKEDIAEDKRAATRIGFFIVTLSTASHWDC
jgi:hypothetical protein